MAGCSMPMTSRHCELRPGRQTGGWGAPSASASSRDLMRNSLGPSFAFLQVWLSLPTVR